MKKIFLSIFLFALFLKNEVRSNEKIAFFIPPEKWEVVNPKGYPSYVVISFVKKEITICRPTLNLATEKTSLTLEQYVNEAKKIHTKDPDASYKILDKIQLSDGPAFICKINRQTDSKDFEILQMLFVKDDIAYVLTGACKKEKMLNNYQTFLNVFSSFKIVDDLFSLACDKEKKELLEQFNKISTSLKNLNDKESKKKLLFFEKYLDKKFTKLGKYFQILLINKVYKTQRLVK